MSEIKALKEECGEVSVGGVSKQLSDIHLYVTLTNQSSVVVFQVPKDNYSEEIKGKIDAVAHFIQIARVSV